MPRRFKPRSLRARLAFWHAGLLALTLLLLSVLTLSVLRTVLSSRMDEGLRDYADKTARSIATALYQSSIPGKNPPARFLSGGNNITAPFLQIVDAHTNAVKERSASLGGSRLPTDLDARVNASRGLATFQTRYELGEHPVRMVTMPVQMGTEVPYLVQAAASLQGVEEALQRTSLILLVLTPIVFSLSLLGGWLLVGRSLQPVDAMTRTAMAMEPGRLDRRIEPVGSDDEISRLASAFNEMMGRLDRSFRQIRQFSADASHELRTPLTSIRGEAEVALMGDLSSEQYRKTLSSIIDEVERMSAIVENLLLLARADAEQVTIRRERLELEDVVLRVYEQMEGIARRKGVSLNLGEMDSAEVEGDPLWLGQILTNLVNNAVKYTPAGGDVTLSLMTAANVSSSELRVPPGDVEQLDVADRHVGAAGLQAVIQHPTMAQSAPKIAQTGATGSLMQNHGRVALVRITDTGPGIAREHLPRLFDRFYRVDSGRSRDAGGVGLGLNIAQWAAHAHDGEITVESEVGKGTTFILELPLA